MNKYIVSWQTHTMHGGLYEGKKTIRAENEDEAANKCRREVQRGAFQDLWESSIKVIEITRQF